MRVEVHRIANADQRGACRRRELYFVCHPADIDDGSHVVDGEKLTAESTDHRRRLVRIGTATTPVACRWQIATAKASAASAAGIAFRLSSTRTMCCTCDLSPAPVPVTACLTRRAAYSATCNRLATTAARTAPRACPSLSADCALRATNTCSIATMDGACVAISVSTA